MRDLDIWQRLRTDAITAADLRALAGATLAQRAPFVGGVIALVDHADPELRAAAVHALAGVRGVAGVRAIVAHLADPDAAVREAALAALRETAREAPMRYAHALFHPEASVRIAALANVPAAAGELAAYLRADPACAELAAVQPWPNAPLPLAFDLHARGACSHRDLLELLLRTPVGDVRAFVASELARSTETVEAYLEAAARGTHAAAPGIDVLDAIVAAIAETADELARRALEMLVQMVATTKSGRAVLRRCAAALLHRLATRWSSMLWGACVALEPSVLAIAMPAAVRADIAAVIAALFTYRWPVKPTKKQVDRLLASPLARGDLALAVALAGLYSDNRLKHLAARLGVRPVIDALVASDRGWSEICSLPRDTPALEIAWLARVEKANPARYVALAGLALATIREPARLTSFVEQIPRAYRPGVYLDYVRRDELADPRFASTTEIVANRLDRAGLAAILATLLGDAAWRAPYPVPSVGGDVDAGALIALTVLRALPDKIVAALAQELSDPACALLVPLLDGPLALPRSLELALAGTFAKRADPAARTWGEKASALAMVSAVTIAQPRVRMRLRPEDHERIATCSARDLERALEPALRSPVSGLIAALARRPPSPSLAACTALLGCTDLIAQVAEQLERFASPNPRFDDELDNAAVQWHSAKDLPVLARARLSRWEVHTVALAEWVNANGGTLAVLRSFDAIAGRIAQLTLWRGVAETVVFARYRDRAMFARGATRELAQFAAERIDRPYGKHAARIVVALVEGSAVPQADVRDAVLARAADCDAETRELIARIARLDGMPEPPRVAAPVPTPDTLAQVKSCTDLDELVAWCKDGRPAVVQEAVLALVIRGEAGQQRLAQLLPRLGELAAPLPIVASIALWDRGPALDAARELAADPTLPAAWRFHLHVGLGDATGALAAVHADDPGWFRREDWDALVALVADPIACALAVIDAPHHHAYQRAVAIVMELRGPPEIPAALRRFLAQGTTRPLQLRRDVAWRLVEWWGDATGLPILVEMLADEVQPQPYAANLPRAMFASVLDAIVDAALIAGGSACSEKRMWALIAQAQSQALVDAEQLGRLLARVLEEASTATARRNAAAILSVRHSGENLRAVAEVFAWGVRRGVELCGKLFRISMTSVETEYGHTYLTESRIYVSPLPLLRRELHGRDIVEGLILHELGHHIYHADETSRALWKRAHAEGLGHLLNLIADEHLERNMRAVDRLHGDRLKRLDAYAFQHAPQEIRVPRLLGSLRGGTAAALTASALGVAYDELSLRLRRGDVMIALDRAAHPLARFARALRLGLGNRANDPLVAQALALCNRRDLRSLDMRAMYELTRELSALFGGATALASVFGGPEGLEFGERDDDVFGAGIDDQILQREVERILEPRRSGASGRSGPRDRLCINVNPDERFDKIASIQRVRGDRAQHEQLAKEVHRHAVRLRRFLDELGLRWELQRARMKGHAIDRTRLRALVTRNDPRLLLARTPTRRTDLFLGTIVDCSGSMQAGQNIERAKKFAILIAEAVRPLAGVEARFFGFTDSLIYDAGDAHDCDVTALHSDGGNNDAAALYHAANVAVTSRKRAKVLVMISDGLPTECSVAALRALVTQLSKRKHIVCAQVAVRKLDEQCFPNYVVLDDAEPDVAVARFGRMIGELVQRSLKA